MPIQNTEESDGMPSTSSTPPVSQKRPHEKKARTFNLDEMFTQAIAHAPSFKDGNAHQLSMTNEIDEPTRKAFEKTNLSTSNENESDDDDVGPALPPGFVPDNSVIVKDGAAREDEYEKEEEESASSASRLVPTECEVIGEVDQKTPITALAIDPQGTKFAIGNVSYYVYLYDYLRMDSSMKPFRDIMPSENHVINDLTYSNNGEYLVVASGESILKVLDRNGQQWCETARGDQYLVDAALTKGHTATVNCCRWHPFSKTEFLTCSNDGTVRVWSTEDFKEITNMINTQRSVIKTKNAAGKRIIPRRCCYSRDGKLIAAGCDDGSIYIWKHGKVFVNPKYMNRTSHKGAITGMEFSPDGKRLVTRSMDHSLKLFDLASFKQPLYEVNGLENNFEGTDCSYSPRAEFIFTGYSILGKKEQYSGGLNFYSSDKLELLYKIEYPNAGCIRSVWHPKIDQILVTLTDGTFKHYYDSNTSNRGVRLCAHKAIRKARASELFKEEFILAPLGLEMFQPRGEEGEEKEVTEFRIKKYLRMQEEDGRPKFRKPADMPSTGRSAGGRIAESGGTLHSYIAQQLGTERNMDFLTDRDVRGSILRHAEEAEKNPIYITKAYEKTQPKPIFQMDHDDDDDAEPVYKAQKRGNQIT